MGLWTARFLSYAGRLNLISSVIWSITNFWLAAFRLPKSCLREIEKLCSAFLWSGQELNPHKAKISWEEICKPKSEGGLGLRSLHEVNDVSVLKLIWRIASHGNSLWVRWIEVNLIKRDCFWAIRNSTSIGSWMWKKILKFRPVAKPLCKVEVGNGENTSFWYDNWSNLGCLMDVVGPRGIIELGIGRRETVAEVGKRRRRGRRYRTAILNTIEEALTRQTQNRTEEGEDILLWRGKGDVFRPTFSTRDTWNHVRTTSNKVAWHKGVWFTHMTPKYAFCTWLAMHNRLSTGDRMISWNVGASGLCVLCQNTLESRDHLFFSCVYSSAVWTASSAKLLSSSSSNEWTSIVDYISNQRPDRINLFLVRYVFQVSIHTIWHERNARRHGDLPNPASTLIGWIDRQVRNQASAIHEMGDYRYKTSLQQWFASRT